MMTDILNNDDAPGRQTAQARRETEAGMLGDADQAAAVLDQTNAHVDQVASDSDQLVSDRDQELADREQNASDRDQATAERLGRDDNASRRQRDAATREREATATERSKTTALRMAAAIRRDEAAAIRDHTAAARDATADARDRAATARDQAVEAQELRAAEPGDLDDVIVMLRTLRLSSAARRQQSELERLGAANDREAAAADRKRAAMERRHAGLDELTGVLRRGIGEAALTQEIQRSRRTRGSLVIAMIDVDELKAANDEHGHAAGDALLRDVGAAIAATLRGYDVTVRWGGDEFVCALSNVTLQVAGDRIAEIRDTLKAIQPGASISAGLAEVCDDDNLESVILRADAALYGAKTSRQV